MGQEDGGCADQRRAGGTLASWCCTPVHLEPGHPEEAVAGWPSQAEVHTQFSADNQPGHRDHQDVCTRHGDIETGGPQRTVWSVLDGLMWFFQQALDKASQPLMACRLVSRSGLWMYMAMGMGIMTSPFYCQAGNAAMFWPMERDEFRSTVDEFICMSCWQNKYEPADDLEVQLWHVQVLRQFLYLLGDHGGRVSFPKAQLCCKHVQLYGLVWGDGLIRKPKDEMQAILDWPYPSGRRQQKQLLSTVCAWQWLAGQGMATEFTEKTCRMREMANRRGPWRADEFEKCKDEFDAMQQELAENIAVNMVWPDLCKVVSGDWSARGLLAGVLSQLYPDGTQHPCAVYLRKCTPAESQVADNGNVNRALGFNPHLFPVLVQW
jgi:hypothetical protein